MFVSSGVSQLEKDVKLNNYYLEEKKSVSDYIDTVRTSQEAVFAFEQPLKQLAQNLPYDSGIQITTFTLYNDTIDLVRGLTDLLGALKIKEGQFKAKAQSFPQEVSIYLSNLDTVSNEECSRLNSALTDLT